MTAKLVRPLPLASLTVETAAWQAFTNSFSGREIIVESTTPMPL